MNHTITCSTEISLSFDPEFADFKRTMKGYQSMIKEHGELEDLLEHIAHNIIHFGYDHLIEGVGYVKPLHLEWIEVQNPHSGVELVSDWFPRFDFEHHNETEE